MVQLKQVLTLQLSEDSGANPQLLLSDINETSAIQDTLNEALCLEARIETGVSDQSIGLGTLSAPQGLSIKSDEEISIKLNNTDGTDREITLKPNLPSVLHADYTALYISNSSGNPAHVRIIAWGEQ